MHCHGLGLQQPDEEVATDETSCPSEQQMPRRFGSKRRELCGQELGNSHLRVK